MSTLTLAFIVAWAATTAYIAWLGSQQRTLVRRLNEWEAMRERRGVGSTENRKAA